MIEDSVSNEDASELEKAIHHTWERGRGFPQNERHARVIFRFIMLKQLEYIELEHCTIVFRDSEIITRYKDPSKWPIWSRTSIPRR